VPALRYLGIGLIPWSPLAGGLLAGTSTDATAVRRADPTVQAQVRAHADELDAFAKLCAQLGHAPAEVALAWLLHQPVVPAVITGPRTPAQLESSERALAIELDADTLAELDRIWPGPGEAPQAYAW
jgi:aryl-alcohol dehydrogenase-like predicted oxidoreductase